MQNSSHISVYSMIANADIVVQSVLLTLLIASITSWVIIFDKIFKFKKLEGLSSQFESDFDSGKQLEEIYKKSLEIIKKANHPLALIFVACIDEWKSSNVKKIISEISDAGNYSRANSLKDRLNSVMQVTANRSLEKMEVGFNFLAMTGSVAPFIGLFGTVWGIMNSFQAIAANNNTSLAVVAPGIAESLFATAIGLFAAIPAVLFYNIFTAKINKFNERTNNFSTEILNVLSRKLDGSSS